MCLYLDLERKWCTNMSTLCVCVCVWFGMVRHFLENPTGRAPEQQVKLTFITQQIWKLVGNGWWWCIPDSVQPLTYLICTNDNQNRKTLLKLWKRLENGAHPNFRIRFIYTEEELYMCFNWKHIFDHKSFLVDFRTSGRQTNKKKKISLRTLQEGGERKKHPAEDSEKGKPR